MGEGSGRGSGRVGSDFLSAIEGRVGSGPRKVTRGQLWYVLFAVADPDHLVGGGDFFGRVNFKGDF